MQVFTNPLDRIVFWATRRQKVKSHFATLRSQCLLDLAAVVDLVAVEDDMNPTSVPVGNGHQPVDEEEKQDAVFAFSVSGRPGVASDRPEERSRDYSGPQKP